MGGRKTPRKAAAPVRPAPSGRRRPGGRTPPVTVEALRAELDVQKAQLEAQNLELIAAHETIQESRDRYADLFDFSPVPYLVLDGNGVIEDINLTAAGMLGLRRSQARRLPFLRLIAAGDHARFWDHMERCRSGMVHLSTDVELRPRGGQCLHVALVTAPHTGVDRKEFRTALIDLRERIQLAEQHATLAREQARREQAEQSDRSKDELLAMLAHDLRGPLSAIDTWAHLLSTGRLGEDEKRRAIDIIERNVRAQADLISEMLEVSRIIRGDVPLERVPIHLGAVVRAVIQAAAPVATSRRVRLEMRLDPAGAMICGDPVRIRQIVSGLITNAMHATPAGGRVQVSLDRSLWEKPAASSVGGAVQECARLTIRDDRHDASDELVAQLLESLWQPRSNRTSGERDFGMGTVRRLIEINGGVLRAATAGPAHGLTFTVELPLDHTAAVPVETPEPARFEGVRVLVVDARADSLRRLRELLEPYGVRIEAAGSVNEAIEALRRFQPDVLFADLSSDSEEALAMIRRVRELAPADGGATPAIAVRTDDEPIESARVISAGFESLMAWPADGGRLGALFARLARSRQPVG